MKKLVGREMIEYAESGVMSGEVKILVADDDPHIRQVVRFAVPRPAQGAADRWLTQVGERLEPTLVEAQKITLAGMSVVDVRGNVVATTNNSQRDRALRGIGGRFLRTS